MSACPSATKHQAFRDAASRQCACGRAKVIHIPFCEECVPRLKDQILGNLMNHRIPFAESYSAALAQLNLESHAAREDRARAEAATSGIQAVILETQGATR